MTSYETSKRVFDFTVSLIALIIFSPVIFITAVVVRLKLGSPVLFTQLRPGINGQPFAVYKFRSMTDARSPTGELLSDADRLGRFGQLLRKTSLDELPQLWNVLKGDLSLVGPRPLLMEYLPLYSDRQARRHDVKPGITGWAQVNGRNAVDWEDRLELDVWYVENRTFMLDLKILVMTVARVINPKDVSQPGQVTMTRFTGKKTKL